MKIFENPTERLELGQEAKNFPVGENQSLSDLKGSAILLVFWKTL